MTTRVKQNGLWLNGKNGRKPDTEFSNFREVVLLV